ncbi:MAG: hypothetical protein IKQ61_00090 [Spirochaetales bacterium]|nr:hypothetical protein [Spirochaetales bacterium]
MNKINILMMSLILLISASVCAAAQEEKPKIAILDLSSLGGLNNENAMIVRENLTTSFVKTKKYRVVERSMLNKIFQEMKLVNSDDFSEDEIVEIGRLAKAKFVVTGSLSKTSETYFLNIRVIEVETAEIVYAENQRFNSIYESDFVTDNIAASIAGLAPGQVIRTRKTADSSSSGGLSARNIVGIALTATSGLLTAAVIPLAILSAVGYDNAKKAWIADAEEHESDPNYAGLGGKSSADKYAGDDPQFVGCLAGAIVCPIVGIMGLIIFAPWITERSKVAMALSHVEVGYRYGLTNEGVSVGMKYKF